MWSKDHIQIKRAEGLGAWLSLLLQEAVTSLKHASNNPPSSGTPAGQHENDGGNTSGDSQPSGSQQPRTAASSMDIAALMKIISPESQSAPSSTGKSLSFDPFDFDINNMEASPVKPKDIKDYVTLLQTREKQTVSLGGIELTIPETKPKLESISPLQYMEASLKIMREMALKDGADLETVLHYAGYLIKIANMGQRFNWQSVIKYDTEYRKYQASGQFVWGADNAWTMMMFLREGLGSQPQRDTNKWSTPRQRDNFHTKYDPQSGKPVCEKFNGRFGCALPSCRYAHVCRTCFDASHAQVNHNTISSAPPRFQPQKSL